MYPEDAATGFRIDSISWSEPYRMCDSSHALQRARSSNFMVSESLVPIRSHRKCTPVNPSSGHSGICIFISCRTSQTSGPLSLSKNRTTWENSDQTTGSLKKKHEGCVQQGVSVARKEGGEGYVRIFTDTILYFWGTSSDSIKHFIFDS